MGLVLVMNKHEDEIIPLLRENAVPELQYVSHPYDMTGTPSSWPNAVRTVDGKWMAWFEGSYLHYWGNNLNPANPIDRLLRKIGVRIVDSF